MNFTQEEKLMLDQIEALKTQLKEHQGTINNKEWLIKKYDILYDTLVEIQEYLIGEIEFKWGEKWNVLIAIPTWSWKERKISVDTTIVSILNLLLNVKNVER